MEYEYRAVTKDGLKKTGVMNVSGQSELARSLREDGYFLVWAKEKIVGAEGGSKKTGFWVGLNSSIGTVFKRVGLDEKMIFSRHLALMIKSGFSLNRALEVLAKQTPNKYFAGVIRDLAVEVSSGKTFHQAVSVHAGIFPPVFLNMVRVGETSGKLVESLRLAARHLKREYSLKRKIRGAMVYPLVIVAAMAGVGAVMMAFVLPQLATTFTELNVPLPLSTQIIFAMSNFMSAYWYTLVFIALALGYAFYFLFRKTELGRQAVNLFFLKTPIFSDITKKINSARFSRTLNSLLAGGVAMSEAISITGGTLTNSFYSRVVLATKDEIEKGKKLSELLAAHPDLFPPMVTEMISVGEETGSLNTMLMELARFFESEVAVATKSMSSIVEPIIMIVIGVAVGIFALSIIQPIYSIGTGL